MNATPIYAELQQTVMDPEATNWDVSSPPAFAAELAEAAKRHVSTGTNSAGTAPAGVTSTEGSSAGPASTGTTSAGTTPAATSSAETDSAAPAARASSKRSGKSATGHALNEDQDVGSPPEQSTTSSGFRTRSNRRHRAGE